MGGFTDSEKKPHEERWFKVNDLKSRDLEDHWILQGWWDNWSLIESPDYGSDVLCGAKQARNLKYQSLTEI